MLLSVSILLLLIPLCGSQSTKIDDNQMGMKVLYDMVNIFLGDVIHKEESVSYFNLTKIFDGDLDSLTEWKSLLNNFIGFSVCIAIGIVLIIVIPLIGLIFCCCRCCGRCGGKSKLHEKKNSKCKRRSYCTILVVLNTVALAGVVCAFLCNHLVYKSLQNDNQKGTWSTISGALDDVQNFLNNSVINASNYVTVTFEETSKDILKSISDSAVEAVDYVLDALNATRLLDNAKSIGTEANKTQVQLDLVAHLLTNLSAEGKSLKQNLTEIKQDLTNACLGGRCQFDPNSYNTSADFSQLDTMSKEAEKVKDSLEMTKNIEQAEKEIQDAKKTVQKDVQDVITDAEKEINKLKDSINNSMKELTNEKNKVLTNFPGARNTLNNIDNDSKDYTKIAYYIGIGVCCAYLLIVLLYYIGILFGLCGERPGDGAPCCNTGTGSNFLMAGVGFTFFFFWVLMIICTVLFAVGGVTYTEVCRKFNGHDPSKLKSVDAYVAKLLKDNIYKDAPSDFSLMKSIQNCQANDALYSALQLDYIVPLDKYTDLSGLEKKIDELKKQTLKLDDIKIFNQELETKLKNFSEALNTINLTSYFSELRAIEMNEDEEVGYCLGYTYERALDKNLTIASLPLLSEGVTAYAQSLKDKDPSDPNIKTLDDIAQRLLQLDLTTLTLMRANVAELRSTLIKLQDQTSLQKTVNELIENLNETRIKFNNEKNTLILEKISVVANKILATTNKTVNGVKIELRENLARCAPLSSALYTISDSFCVLFLNPANGLWFSFGWVLFFFILCLIFAVLLTDQYRIQHKYEKDFDDPNFMYGGSHNDTIPLTSVDQSPRGGGSQPYHLALSNAGYRHDSRPGPDGYPPPSYEEQMRYDRFPPPKYNGHQSADLSPSHPGPPNSQGGGKHYSYPY